MWKRARIRMNLLRMAGVHHLPGQLCPLLRELAMVLPIRGFASRHPAMRGVAMRAAKSSGTARG